GSGPFSVLMGSGALPSVVQQRPNRAGAIAGTTFYVLNADDGSVQAIADAGSVLHAPPVRGAPAGKRDVTNAYIGDLDGHVWRFDVAIDSTGATTVTPTRLFAAGADQPIVGRIAVITVG